MEVIHQECWILVRGSNLMKVFLAFFQRQLLGSSRIVASERGGSEGKRYYQANGLISPTGFAFMALANKPWCFWLIWRIFVATKTLQFSLEELQLVAMLKINRLLSHDCTSSVLWPTFKVFKAYASKFCISFSLKLEFLSSPCHSCLCCTLSCFWQESETNAERNWAVSSKVIQFVSCPA